MTESKVEQKIIEQNTSNNLEKPKNIFHCECALCSYYKNRNQIKK